MNISFYRERLENIRSEVYAGSPLAEDALLMVLVRDLSALLDVAEAALDWNSGDTQPGEDLFDAHCRKLFGIRVALRGLK